MFGYLGVGASVGDSYISKEIDHQKKTGGDVKGAAARVFAMMFMLRGMRGRMLQNSGDWGEGVPEEGGSSFEPNIPN